jgi:hypothetical protein
MDSTDFALVVVSMDSADFPLIVHILYCPLILQIFPSSFQGFPKPKNKALFPLGCCDE